MKPASNTFCPSCICKFGKSQKFFLKNIRSFSLPIQLLTDRHHAQRDRDGHHRQLDVLHPNAQILGTLQNLLNVNARKAGKEAQDENGQETGQHILLLAFGTAKKIQEMEKKYDTTQKYLHKFCIMLCHQSFAHIFGAATIEDEERLPNAFAVPFTFAIVAFNRNASFSTRLVPLVETFVNGTSSATAGAFLFS